MKIDKLMMAAVAGTGLAMASAAQAVTVQDFILQNQNVLFSDDSGEEIIKAEGNTNANRIQEGDVIRGVFGVNFGSNTNGSNLTPLLHVANNQELTGSFSLKIVSKTRISDGRDGVSGTPDDEYNFVFGVDESYANGTNSLIRLYVEDPSGTSYVPNLYTTKAAARATTTDGDFFAGIGLANAGNAIIGTGSDFFGAPGRVLGDVGSSLFALDITESGTIDGGDALDSLPLVTLVNNAGSGVVIGASLLRGPQGPWDLTNDFNFELSVVPTPAAVGPGLALLGFLMARRRRQA